MRNFLILHKETAYLSAFQKQNPHFDLCCENKIVHYHSFLFYSRKNVKSYLYKPLGIRVGVATTAESTGETGAIEITTPSEGKIQSEKETTT